VKREECEGFGVGIKKKMEDDAEVNIVELGFTQSGLSGENDAKEEERCVCLFGV